MAYDTEYDPDQLGSIIARLDLNQGQPVDKQVDADGTPVPTGTLAQRVALQIAQGVGGAAGGMGSDARLPDAPAPAPTTNIRYFDDRAEKPKRSFKDMALMGLIPLGAGLLGGLMNGQQGAYAGAESGLEAVGKKVDDEDKRYGKLQDEKELNRSKVVTARLLKQIGGKTGGPDSINKNRYQKIDGIDPATGTPYSYVFDRQEGRAGQLQGLDGTPIPYSSEIYKRWRPVAGAQQAVPVAAVAPGGPAPSAPAAAPAQAPAPDAPGGTAKGGVAVTPAPKGYKVKKGLNPDESPESAPPTRLPPDVKTPAAPAAAQAPAGDDDSPEASRDLFKTTDQNLAEMIAAAEKDQDPLPRQLPNGQMESIADVDARVKRADKAHSEAVKARNQNRQDYMKARAAAEQITQRGGENRKTKATPGAPRPGTAPGEKPLSDKQTKEISDFDTAIEKAQDVLGGARDEWLGQYDGRVPEAVPGILGGPGPDQVEFRSKVGRMLDAYRHLITGAGASMKEISTLESRLPRLTDRNAANFDAKAKGYIDELKKAREIYLGNMQKAGKNTAPFQSPAQSESAGSAGQGVEPPEGDGRTQSGNRYFYSRKAKKYLPEQEYNAGK
jgi:hypothetical protein